MMVVMDGPTISMTEPEDDKEPVLNKRECWMYKDKICIQENSKV